jgi:hypothetical protein
VRLAFLHCQTQGREFGKKTEKSWQCFWLSLGLRSERGTALPGYLPKKNQLRSNLMSEQTFDPTRPLCCDLCSVIITEGPEDNLGQVTADCVLCQDCLEKAIHSA